MSYQLPLSERIRIQFEILCENCADCFSSLSGSYKKPIFFLASCMVFLTLRSAKRNINKVKMGGGLTGYGSSSYSSGYGTSSYGAGSSSLTGGYGGYGSGSSTGGLMGGSSTSYGMRGAAPSMSSSFGGSSYGTSMGASSFGSTMGGNGKGTANLVDANPSGVITLDPSIKFYDFGGSTDFYGQVEVVQAFDAAAFVSQILSQPGQSKVLVVDGSGSLNSALFDAEMASSAMRNGWKGVVVNGAIRNSAQLATTQFGVKALGTNPMKSRGMNGQRGAGITIGSTQIQTGLWLYADKDGIVLSQSDVSGGSFGGSSGSSFGATAGGYGSSSLTGGYGSSSMTGGYGGASSFGGASFGSSQSSLTGGYGTSSSLTGGYSGASSPMTGGTSLAGGYSSGNTMGSSSYGSSSSMYGGSSSYGSSYGSSSPYGRSTYSSYSTRRKKHKMFKILLASSIAAIVWIVCLR